MGWRKAVLVCLFAAAVATCSLPRARGRTEDEPADADIGGIWRMTFANKSTAEMTIAQDKQVLKVTMKVQDNVTLSGAGTIKADVAEWSVSVTTRLRSVTWDFRAKVAGDTMSGEARLGTAGTTKWTASKKRLPQRRSH